MVRREALLSTEGGGLVRLYRLRHLLRPADLFVRETIIVEIARGAQHGRMACVGGTRRPGSA
eukprot:6214292-Pleurochrysis_carterae.AAC.1